MLFILLVSCVDELVPQLHLHIGTGVCYHIVGFNYRTEWAIIARFSDIAKLKRTCLELLFACSNQFTSPGS